MYILLLCSVFAIDRILFSRKTKEAVKKYILILMGC